MHITAPSWTFPKLNLCALLLRASPRKPGLEGSVKPVYGRDLEGFKIRGDVALVQRIVRRFSRWHRAIFFSTPVAFHHFTCLKVWDDVSLWRETAPGADAPLSRGTFGGILGQTNSLHTTIGSTAVTAGRLTLKMTHKYRMRVHLQIRPGCVSAAAVVKLNCRSLWSLK